jgi:hypothetical protein
MMYPYAEFLINFDRKHGAFTHGNCPENTRAAVIVETRPLYFLPKVIKNTMFFLGPRWNLHIFSGELSHPYIEQVLQGWSVGLRKLPGTYRLSSRDYNGILTSPSFWNSFSEDKLLIFQTDCILSGPNIDDFAGYDYIGAPCGRFDEHFIVNGGLSLRTRRTMLECVTHFRPGSEPEDVFFTKALREAGSAMPDLNTAYRFAVESIYTEHPVGVHGTDKCFHSVEVAEKIAQAIRF